MMIITSTLGLQLNRAYAVDVASGRVPWKHEHKLPEELPGLVRILPMNRGVAHYKDKVYFDTLDAHLVALKATTGEVTWKTKVADAMDGYFFTMAPLTVKGKIIVGSSGPGGLGARGFIAVFEADTG